MTWKSTVQKLPRWIKVPIALVYYWGIQIKAWWNRVEFEAEMAKAQKLYYPENILCSLCGKYHEVELSYKDIPIVVCPEAEDGKVYGFKSERRDK